MSETIPAVLSEDGSGRLKTEIEGLAATLDVAGALALGRARLLDLLATVLHRDAEIAALRAQLAAVTAERNGALLAAEKIDDDLETAEQRVAALEAEIEALRTA